MSGHIFRLNNENITHLYRALLSRVVSILHNLWDYCYHKILTIYLVFRKKTIIHVIGDSHTGAFRNNRFIVHHIGAPTAYNLTKWNTTTRSREKLFAIINRINKTKDVAILVFGEIDCRIHIYYQYKRNGGTISMNKFIKNTINAYDSILQELHSQHINFFVYSIPPAGKYATNIYNYPYYATPEMRSWISKQYNQELSNLCKNRGYSYINIYDQISDHKGFMMSEFAADSYHLNKKITKLVKEIMIKEYKVDL